jgi:hypothetical protein
LTEFNNLKGRCVVSDLGLIYIGNPKTGSSSIHQLLGGYNANLFDLEKKNLLQGNLVFSVLRHPLTRFISGYLEILYYLHLFGKEYEHISYYEELLFIKDENRRFEKFVSLCEQQLLDIHVMKQTFFLTDFNNQLFPIDDILLFESLNFDFNKLCAKKNIQLTLGIYNQKSNISVNRCIFQLKNDSDLTTRINRIYDEDYELYFSVLKRKIKNDVTSPLVEGLISVHSRNSLLDRSKYFFEKYPTVRSRMSQIKKDLRSLLPKR